MKRQISIILALLLCVCALAAGCSNGASQEAGGEEPMLGPSAQVEADIEELKTGSTEDIAKFLGAKDILKKADSDLADRVAAKMMEFDYTVTGEELSDDGESAAVTVEVTTYDFGSAAKSAVKGLAVKILAGTIDRDDTQAVVEYMLSRVLNTTKKDFTAEVTVHCTLSGDAWETDLAGNEEFRTALQGGFMEAIESYL